MRVTRRNLIAGSTAAAGLAGFPAIAIGFATRTLTLRGLWAAGIETVQTTAMLFIIIVIGAFIFSRLIVLTQFPLTLSNWVSGQGLSPSMVILAVVALYLLLGTFLEEVSTLLITVPVLLAALVIFPPLATWLPSQLK